MVNSLNRLLINALHKAVNEFVNNEMRDQPHYRAGYGDGFFDRPTAELPADNASQRRWYWTGAILGWAQKERWQRIVQALDEHEIVRDLGDGADHASRDAGLQIAKALWKTNRTAELATFVHKALAQMPDVFQLLLDAGTQSLRTLRSDEADVARQVFALLMDCIATGAAREVPSDVLEMEPTVRRRMAHCLRLLDEHRRAEELLQGLLEERPSADVEAMVHADLGLLKGHFLLLDEVRIPSEREARQNTVERLSAGKSDFRRSAAIENGTYAAHGDYCLGALALADDAAGETRYETAHRHLDRARAHFRSAHANYPPSLVAQADLYLGIAKAQLLTAADIEHASRLIAEGLGNGAQMPTHLIQPTVDALANSKSAIEEVARWMLEIRSDEALDALAQSTPRPELALVAKRLHERAHLPRQSQANKAKDLRRALAWFLTLDDKRSSDVLDELEELAASGVAVDEFIKLLSDPSGYDPVWNNDDAATAIARCHEARGDYANALASLQPIFHRHMFDKELDDARALLEWVRTLGLDPDAYRDMEYRYSAATEQSTERASTQSGDKQVAVLVVGGDESHAKSEVDVAKQVRDLDAAVSVDFIAIDWTSNWKKTLEDVRRRLPNVDAVVLMRFMRTTFGQHVRKLCSKHDIPWRFCYGGGRGARASVVLKAAEAVRAD